MTVYGLPVLYALFVWWFSTGAVLYIVGRNPKTYRWSMAAATAVALLALYVLADSSTDTSTWGAYAAFTAALTVWGWHEMSFLTGLVTGPRTTASERGEREDKRAALWPAVETLLYHEAAILLTALLLFGMLAGSPNQVGLWTFVILWVMRLSAKLNVYLGVPNLSEEFLPDHLRYLKSYFCRRPMNVLFPVSVTLATIATVLVVAAAADPGAGEFEAAGLTFLATLLALAVLEHWFLVVPLPASALWSWGLSSRKPVEASTGRDPAENAGDGVKAVCPATLVA